MRATELEREDRTTAGAPRGGLRPAALARLVDLPGLRHDFPLVLTDDEHRPVVTLTTVVDELLGATAPPGARGERLRQHVLRLETALRRRLEDESAPTDLVQLWDEAAERLLAGADDGLADSLATARAALHVDGRVVRCDDDAPATVVHHLHAHAAAPGATVLAGECSELVRRLGAVLSVDQRRSATGRAPARLQAAVGGPHADDFDFAAWSEVLAARPHDTPMPEARRTRIEWALDVLRDQRFVATGTDGEGPSTYDFSFDGVDRALTAHHDRLPELARVVKAMTIAQLELDNEYDESVHGAFFHAYDAAGLRPDDFSPFPGSLVVLDGDELDPSTRAQVLDVLVSPLPWKVVVVTRDALGRSLLHSPVEPRPLSGTELAAAARGLGTARVVQTTSAGLARMAAALRDALAADGPALVSIVTGTVVDGVGLPGSLAAAAAAEARLVPEYAYDPHGGPDGDARLDLAPTAQPAADWPVHTVEYEDEHLQRVREEQPFTVADLAAVDPRLVDHTTVVPRAVWTEAMVPFAAFLQLDEPTRRGRVPYVLVVDEHDVLRRVAVDDRVVGAAEATLAAWRRLQELAGVRATEERRRLAEERAALEAALDAAREAGTSDRTPSPGTAPSATPTTGVDSDAVGPATDERDVAAAPVEAVESGEPWIETARCTTCDECTNLNPRMFAYNEDKQAYIADVHAGTYGELVQAAEACQVAIIHPGEPWDPDEPGLDDLRRRAAAFD